MYFHTDSEKTVRWLAAVLATAEHHGRSVRFAVGGDGSLKVKVGEGAWTAPIASTPDPYRDQSGWCRCPRGHTHRPEPDCPKQ